MTTEVQPTEGQQPTESGPGEHRHSSEASDRSQGSTPGERRRGSDASERRQGIEPGEGRQGSEASEQGPGSKPGERRQGSESGMRRRGSEPARALRLVQQAGIEANQELARRLGIGITDLAAMEHLSSAESPMGPVELGHRLGIRSASATALVDRLEQSGHVNRQARPDDRRRVALIPSAQSGIDVLAALSPLLAEIDAAAARLSPDEAAAVTRFLTEAAAAMRHFAHGEDAD